MTIVPRETDQENSTPAFAGFEFTKIGKAPSLLNRLKASDSTLSSRKLSRSPSPPNDTASSEPLPIPTSILSRPTLLQSLSGAGTASTNQSLLFASQTPSDSSMTRPKSTSTSNERSNVSTIASHNVQRKAELPNSEPPLSQRQESASESRNLDSRYPESAQASRSTTNLMPDNAGTLYTVLPALQSQLLSVLDELSNLSSTSAPHRATLEAARQAANHSQAQAEASIEIAKTVQLNVKRSFEAIQESLNVVQTSLESAQQAQLKAEEVSKTVNVIATQINDNDERIERTVREAKEVIEAVVLEAKYRASTLSLWDERLRRKEQEVENRDREIADAFKIREDAVVSREKAIASAEMKVKLTGRLSQEIQRGGKSVNTLKDSLPVNSGALPSSFSMLNNQPRVSAPNAMAEGSANEDAAATEKQLEEEAIAREYEKRRAEATQKKFQAQAENAAKILAERSANKVGLVGETTSLPVPTVRPNDMSAIGSVSASRPTGYEQSPPSQIEGETALGKRKALADWQDMVRAVPPPPRPKLHSQLPPKPSTLPIFPDDLSPSFAASPLRSPEMKTATVRNTPPSPTSPSVRKLSLPNSFTPQQPSQSSTLSTLQTTQSRKTASAFIKPDPEVVDAAAGLLAVGGQTIHIGPAVAPTLMEQAASLKHIAASHGVVLAHNGRAFNSRSPPDNAIALSQPVLQPTLQPALQKTTNIASGRSVSQGTVRSREVNGDSGVADASCSRVQQAPGYRRKNDHIASRQDAPFHRRHFDHYSPRPRYSPSPSPESNRGRELDRKRPRLERHIQHSVPQEDQVYNRPERSTSPYSNGGDIASQPYKSYRPAQSQERRFESRISSPDRRYNSPNISETPPTLLGRLEQPFQSRGRGRGQGSRGRHGQDRSITYGEGHKPVLAERINH